MRADLTRNMTEVPRRPTSKTMGTTISKARSKVKKKMGAKCFSGKEPARNHSDSSQGGITSYFQPRARPEPTGNPEGLGRSLQIPADRNKTSSV